jgi:hypothetical protein
MDFPELTSRPRVLTLLIRQNQADLEVSLLCHIYDLLSKVVQETAVCIETNIL